MMALVKSSCVLRVALGAPTAMTVAANAGGSADGGSLFVPANVRAQQSTTSTALTTTTTQPPSTTTTTSTTTSTTSTTTPTTAEFLCPAGGLDEVRDLQAAVDSGHQPWRVSAPDVAAACTFGIPGTAVEPAGENGFRVTQLGTGQAVLVTLVQPLISEGGLVWVVTSVVPVEGDPPPSGTGQLGLPSTR
jgi:hypothetical protein